MKTYEFSGEVWRYEGPSGWYFVTLPKQLSLAIKAYVGKEAGAWGSVPVEVEIRERRWNTSIFRDRKRDAYLLPIKASIRKALRIDVDSHISGVITVNVSFAFAAASEDD